MAEVRNHKRGARLSLGLWRGAERPGDSRWKVLLALSATVAGGYLIAMLRPLRGSLLSSYRFMSSDSFDWLLEGFALSRRLHGVPMIELPVLRNPAFVAVTFADFELSAGGRLILLAIAVSVFLMSATLILTARSLSGRVFETAAIVAIAIACPVAYFRVYVMADQIASSLMIAAVAALIAYSKGGRRVWLAIGGLTAMLAGLTQLYGLIPFLVVGGWSWLTGASRRRPDWALSVVLMGAFAGTIAISASWLALVPHVSTPEHLGLFEMSWGNARFYWNAWTFAFATSMPVVLMVIWKCRRRIIRDPFVTGCWISVAVLAVGTFLYQWQDFRLTMPVSALLSLTLVVTVGDGARLGRIRVSRPVFGAAAALSLASAVLIAPASWQIPKIAELDFDPLGSNMGLLLTTTPNDRFGIAAACGNDKLICQSWRVPSGLTSYQATILETFEEMATRQNGSAR